MRPTFLSLFSGIGGLDKGFEDAGFECVAQCEIDPFGRAVLAKHWPKTFRWSDVCDLPTELIRFVCGTPFAVVGGFACQDVSAAGKGAGIGRHTRSGLTWRNAFRLIRGLRPMVCVLENVPALRTRGADRVLRCLERIGYACQAIVVGAEHVGAPHKRHRVFIIGRLADAEQIRRQAGRGVAGHEERPRRRWGESAVEGDGDGLVSAPGAGIGGQSQRPVHAGQETDHQWAPDHHIACRPGEIGIELGNTSRAASERNAGGLSAPQAGERGARSDDGDLPVGLEYAGDLQCGGQLADAPLRGFGADGRTPGSARHADLGGKGVADAQLRTGDGRSWCAGLFANGDEAGRDESDGGLVGHGETNMADADRAGLGEHGWAIADRRIQRQRIAAKLRWPSRPGQPQHEWEAPRLTPKLERKPQPGLGGPANGIPVRLVSLGRRGALKAFGNAVCPQVAQVIARAILNTPFKELP